MDIPFLIIGTQAVIVGRIDYYFSVFLVLLIPNLLKRIETSEVLPQAGALGKFTELATSPRSVKISFPLLGSLCFAMVITNFSNLVPYQPYLGQ